MKLLHRWNVWDLVNIYMTAYIQHTCRPTRMEERHLSVIRHSFYLDIKLQNLQPQNLLFFFEQTLNSIYLTHHKRTIKNIHNNDII